MASVKFKTVPELYDISHGGGSTGELLEHMETHILKSSGKKGRTVVCLGHNFGWEDAATQLR